MNILKLCMLSAFLVFLPACGDDSNSSNTTDQPTLPINEAPVADAGIDQNVEVGSFVILDGSDSIDKDQDLLTYKWMIVEKPTTSKATLSDALTVNPTIKADVEGRYVLSLIVNDGKTDSQASTVTINAVVGNTAPVPVISKVSENVKVGNKVVLDGSLSTDSDNDSLSYMWTIESKPFDSTAQLSMAMSPNLSIIFDKLGSYTIGLAVSDGQITSEKTTIKVDVVAVNSTPVADAGLSKTVKIDEFVTLDGSKSMDPDNDKLSYEWSVRK